MIVVLCICVYTIQLLIWICFYIIADDWQDFRTWPKGRPLPNWRFAELAASLYFLSSQEDTGLPDNLLGALGDEQIHQDSNWMGAIGGCKNV